MTQRLLELMNTAVLKEGPSGKARMAGVIERTERMVDRYMKGQSVPTPSLAFKLAKACGATEEEALDIAKECSSERCRETA